MRGSSSSPLPVLPPNPAIWYLGEGEYDVIMNIFIYTQVEIAPSPNSTGFVVFGEGRGGAEGGRNAA